MPTSTTTMQNDGRVETNRQIGPGTKTGRHDSILDKLVILLTVKRSLFRHSGALQSGKTLFVATESNSFRSRSKNGLDPTEFRAEN